MEGKKSSKYIWRGPYYVNNNSETNTINGNYRLIILNNINATILPNTNQIQERIGNPAREKDKRHSN